jgi:isopentenyl phosphate kinase
MFLIKLGGSVITNKDKECTFSYKPTRRLVEEMREFTEPLIVTHGGGSFGHKKAYRYKLKGGLVKDAGVDQIAGFCEVQQDMRTLNQYVLDLMNKTGMKAAPVPTCSSVIYQDGEMACMDLRMYDKVLALGAVPVGFGDVVFDTKRVFTICSADHLMYALAKEYRPAKVVFVTDVDGLFDKDPDDYPDAKLIRLVTSLDDLPKGLQPQYVDGKDVTGGMAAKARQAMAIAELGLEVWLVNGHEAERLALVLEGKPVIGTKFISKKTAAPKAKAATVKGPRKGGR